MLLRKGELFAVIAGLCAGLASVAGKFGFGESEGLEVFSFTTKLVPSAGAILLCVRGLFVGLFFFLNAAMWRFHLLALDLCESSARAVVFNTFANIISSGLFGFFFFEEKLSMLWFSGVGLTCAGLLFIQRSTGGGIGGSNDGDSDEKEENRQTRKEGREAEKEVQTDVTGDGETVESKKSR
mmetsp:Transcript_3243/g.6289  ORF Transcript_3243/g.6289 Transcript_3243/m.6289 type:complete len:182 (-) Transcript_3243:398-943(-)